METASLRSRSAYPALLALGALDAAGYGIIAPVLPAISAVTGAGTGVTGALVATFPFAVAIGVSLAGRGAAARGTRTVLVVSLTLLAIGSLGFILGKTLTLFFACRLLMGLGSGGLWVAVTFNVLDRWPGQEYIYMSRVFAAYSLGGLVGPALGAIGGISGPFAAYLLLVLAALPLLLILQPDRRRAFPPDRSSLRLPGFWAASSGIVFAVIGLGVAEGVLPLHFAERLEQGEIGALYVGMSVVVAGAAVLAARFEPESMVVGSALLVTAGLGVAGIATAPLAWIAALLVSGAGVGMGYTGSTGVLLKSVPSERIVTAMLVWSQVGVLGYVAGPLIGGLVVQTLSFAFIVLVPAAAGISLVSILRWADRSTEGS